MTREKIDRREALVRLGASAVVPLVTGFHPLVPAQSGSWTPRFFDGPEVDAVTALAERIIPETETRGARSALVHQYIDFILSQADPAVSERFRSGLSDLERSCRSSFGRSFATLDPSRQDEFLTRFLLHPSAEDPPVIAFVEKVKQLTIEGYYRSEAGMRLELGYDGNAFLTEFDGCTHDEHRDWKPEV